MIGYTHKMRAHSLNYNSLLMLELSPNHQAGSMLIRQCKLMGCLMWPLITGSAAHKIQSTVHLVQLSPWFQRDHPRQSVSWHQFMLLKKMYGENLKVIPVESAGANPCCLIDRCNHRISHCSKCHSSLESQHWEFVLFSLNGRKRLQE